MYVEKEHENQLCYLGNSLTTSKYHRRIPLRNFSPCQTMYNLVRTINEKNMDAYFSSYFGQYRTFRQLLNDTDRLAAAFSADGVSKDQIVGVCLLTTPEVCAVLLSLNKIGAVSYWMDARLKPLDFMKYISDLGIEILVIYEPLVPVFSQLAKMLPLKRIVIVPTNPLTNMLDFHHSTDLNIFTNYYDYIQNTLEISVPSVAFEQGRTTVIVHLWLY